MDVTNYISLDKTTAKKVLFLSPSFNKGGAENQLFKLAAFLKKYGYEVTILAFLNKNDFKNSLQNHNISFVSLEAESIINKVLLLPNLFKAVKKERPDVIVSFMFVANIFSRIIKIIKRIPIVTSVRSYEISNKYYSIYRLSYHLDNVTIFNSDATLKKFIKNRLANPSKSILINNAISVCPLSKEKIRNGGGFTWISIAHFRPAKDYKTLFGAIQLIKEKGFIFNLIVIGNLFGQKWPEEMLAELKIEDEVKLVGYVDDPVKFLLKADALVLSSLWEGTPNAILEAMIAGKPIVASNIPGVSELIIEADCGFLFEKGNVNDLAETMIKIMSTSCEMRVQLGAKGRKYVIEHHDEEKVMQQWLKVIQHLL